MIPPKANSAFVAAMEDVLAVYTRPRDPDRPLVCLDETSKQLIAETRVPIPMKPGRPARFDYEYERNGTANLFMMFAPLEGWRRAGADRGKVQSGNAGGNDRHDPITSNVAVSRRFDWMAASMGKIAFLSSMKSPVGTPVADLLIEGRRSSDLLLRLGSTGRTPRASSLRFYISVATALRIAP